MPDARPALRSVASWRPAARAPSASTATSRPSTSRTDRRTWAAAGSAYAMRVDTPNGLGDGAAGAAQARADLAGEPHVLAQMLTTMGRAYLGLGVYAAADAALTDAAALLDSTGTDPLGHRDALLELANVRFRTEAYGAARRLARQALALDSAHAAPETTERLAILNTVALVASRSGDDAEAARVLRVVIAGRRPLTGEDDQVDLASNLNNLGLILAEQGHADEAAPLLDESIAIVERLRGPTHPYVAFGLNSRVEVDLQRGDTAQAVADLRRALAIGEAALGADHPFTAHARGGLADLLAGRATAGD